MMAMERSPFLPLPDGLVLGHVEIGEAQLTVEVISTQPYARCPGCGILSDAVHCQYQRTIHDVPCAGRGVVLRLRVRKFFCRVPTCPRKVFAERLSDLVRVYARVSNRLLEELKAIGLAASAEVSERLAPRLGMKVKAPTLLRSLRTIKDAPATAVIKVGIDDFSLRRADSYGTILINLETRRPLDLLPDRTAEAVKPWLANHPEIQVVSRDRASAFADAVSQVLPHATQVADRYHLVQNLREHLQQFLDHKRSCLPLVEDTALKSTQVCPTGTAGPPADVAPGNVSHPIPGTLSSEQHEGHICTEADLSYLTYAERKKKISRDKRVARYEEVMALHQEGLGQRAIARSLHMSRNTVQRYISSPVFSERAESATQHASRKSKLDPYLPYLREQWDAGLHNCSRLFDLIKERGYTGCQSGLRGRLSEWRAELPAQRWRGSLPKPRLFAHRGQRRLSSRSASFLMILPPEKLTTKQQHQLEHICQASSALHLVYLLSQEFVTLLKERQAGALHEWLKQAKESQVTELKSFANGIYRDYAAVYAAFSRPESNGITEGHINRLKFLKRQMFGRAHLDLLRVRVLHAV
jgi:transposase